MAAKQSEPPTRITLERLDQFSSSVDNHLANLQRLASRGTNPGSANLRGLLVTAKLLNETTSELVSEIEAML